MKTMILLLLYQLIFLFSGCENQEPEPQTYIGHFELKVTYTTRADPLPDEGSKMYLFSDQAKCPDFYEAMQGYARIDGKTVTSRYRARADENGEIFMHNIEAHSYYMVVISSSREKYTEKIIEVPLGDTLKLIKNFHNSAHHWHDLEPWDYVKPE